MFFLTIVIILGVIGVLQVGSGATVTRDLHLSFANKTYEAGCWMYWGVFCSTFAQNLSTNWYCFVITWGYGAWHAIYIGSLTFRGKLDPSLICKVFLSRNDFIPPDTNPSSTPLWFVVFSPLTLLLHWSDHMANCHLQSPRERSMSTILVAE
jgi:hypothetical protein